MRKNLTKFCWKIEVWAVQKHVNLVDLVTSIPTSIYLQNLASIQPRTSFSKFVEFNFQVTGFNFHIGPPPLPSSSAAGCEASDYAIEMTRATSEIDPASQTPNFWALLIYAHFHDSAKWLHLQRGSCEYNSESQAHAARHWEGRATRCRGGGKSTA